MQCAPKGGHAMNNKLLNCFFVFVVAVGMHSCKKSDGTIVGPPNATNLISNYSFEMNGTPSLQGWEPADTSVARLSPDVPPNGGTWSIYIETSWLPAARVQTVIAMPQGNYSYRLSTWARRQQIGGTVSLLLNGTIRKSLPIVDTAWTAYTISDTLSTVVGDTVIVWLAGGADELLGGRTYFDICRFERLD